MEFHEIRAYIGLVLAITIATSRSSTHVLQNILNIQ